MAFANAWYGPAGRAVAAALCVLSLPALASPAVAETVGAGTSLRTVRVDLQAGALLDPVPFDQAFLIVGRMPPSTRLVEVRIDEYLQQPVSASEAELRRFSASLRAFLDEAGTGGGLTEPQVRRIRELLVEQVRDDAAQGPLGKLWHYGAPWNWTNWGGRFQPREREVVAPGTLLDSRVADPALEGLPSSSTALAELILEQARSARVATYSTSRKLRAPARWRRLGDGGDDAESGTADADGNWNQLERIRSLTGSPDDDMFSGAAAAQMAGDGRGWRPFRVLIEALEADRHYHVRVLLQRDPTAAEVDAFLAAARRRGNTVLEGRRGSLSVADGERLRLVLIESFEAATGGGAVVVGVGGGFLDRSTPYAAVHERTVGLADLWRDAAPDAELDALEAELADLARAQRLVVETGADAATPDDGYVSADAGLLYAPTIGETAATVGANFYLRPVDKAVPLSRMGGLRRLAFTVGLTLNSIEDRRGVRSDLYYNQALVLGAGYRVSQYWRIGAGGLVFRERDPDSYPLTRTRRTALTPYVALTADLDAGGPLKGIGGLFDFLKGGR